MINLLKYFNKFNMKLSKLHSLPKELLIKIIEHDYSDLDLDQIDGLVKKLNGQKDVLLKELDYQKKVSKTEDIKNILLSLILNKPLNFYEEYIDKWKDLSNFLESNKKFITNIKLIRLVSEWPKSDQLQIDYQDFTCFENDIYEGSKEFISRDHESSDKIVNEALVFLNELFYGKYDCWRFYDRIIYIFRNDLKHFQTIFENYFRN
jgi:hypothetical protein